MNNLVTLETISNIAKASRSQFEFTNKKLEFDYDEKIRLGSNGLPLRTYTKTEARNALGEDMDDRKLEAICAKAGIGNGKTNEIGESVWPITSFDIEKVKDTYFEDRNAKEKSGKPYIYVVSNFKGGSAKTTSTINIGAGIATLPIDKKYKVAVIDLDPQASATSILLPLFNEDESFTATDILRRDFELDDGETFSDFCNSCLHETNIPNLHIMPAKPADRTYEQELYVQQFLAHKEDKAFTPHDRLKEITDTLTDFDIVLIDVPPSFSSTVIAAHFAANSLIVPIRPSNLDQDSSVKYFDYLYQLYQNVLVGFGHEGYDYINVLPTAVKSDSATEKLIASKLRSSVNNNAFQAIEFWQSEAISYSSNQNQTIFGHSKSQIAKGKGKTLERSQENVSSIVFAILEQLEKVNLNKKLKETNSKVIEKVD